MAGTTLAALAGITAFLHWRPSKEELNQTFSHTCHVCTSCHAQYQIYDIEDLSGLIGVGGDDDDQMNSGALMFQVLTRELIKKGWKVSEPGVEDKKLAGMKGQDASLDPRLPPIVLTSPQDNDVKLKLMPTRCLSTCGFPQVIALNGGENKFSYQFGKIETDNIDDMVSMINDFCHSKDGYSSTRTRPSGLKGRILARIPPTSGRTQSPTTLVLPCT